MLSQLYEEYMRLALGKFDKNDDEIVRNISKTMDLFETGKFFDAHHFVVSEWRARWATNPILAILLGRICTSKLEVKDYTIELEAKGIKGSRVGYFMDAAFESEEMEVALLEKIPQKLLKEGKFLSDAQATAYLEIHALRQYATYFFLKYNSESDAPLESGKLDMWKKGRFDKLTNYSGIHPFILELCPPHHIWSRYIYNDRLFEVDKNGKLTNRPVEPDDLKQTKAQSEMPAFLQAKK